MTLGDDPQWQALRLGLGRLWQCFLTRPLLDAPAGSRSHSYPSGPKSAPFVVMAISGSVP
jgi:hypothetical protein